MKYKNMKQRIATISPLESSPPETMMDLLSISSLLLLLNFLVASASPTVQPPMPQDAVKGAFRPSLLIVMAVFAVMFTLTFLLLIYAKFCNLAADLFGPTALLPATAAVVPPRTSGVDKTVIESLPFFQFASLKGAREGLECAVCLAAFEDAELLRLLPKCKHAFHVDCVDRWLGDHASCPLCRHRVTANDPATFTSSTNSSFRHPENNDAVSELELELFVEREPSFRRGSSRFTIGGSFRKIDDTNDKLLPPSPMAGGEMLHRFKHRIIVSDVIFNGRWSDVNYSDLVSLNTDMLGVVSSKRFASLNVGSASEIVSGCSLRLVTEPGMRCMSEITDVSRFGTARESAANAGAKREWLQIARRTVQWFAGRERRGHSQYRREAIVV